jgi:ABC-2 type transport system ATP-binding protein
VERLIEMVGLEDHSEQKIRTLSGGQRRRLDVAVGIIGRPELLFLDEPTAGFDPQARREFHDLVRRLTDLEDTTILLTTHDLDEAEKLADRILILAGGRIVANGTADELAKEMTREAQVRWSRNGERFVQATPNVTKFVRELFAPQGEDISDLEVRRATLEDTYIAMVQQYESGHGHSPAATAFEEAAQ